MEESERIKQKPIGGGKKREQNLVKNDDQQRKQTQLVGTNSELIPVYTEWANRLLLAANLPPLTDLSGELCVPQKLIVLILSITFEFQKVPKEKLVALLSDDDPLISIKRSLAYLRQIGIPQIDTVQAKDIRNGHLGAILLLLYHLSCYYHSTCQHRLSQQRAAADEQILLAKQQQQQQIVFVHSSPIRSCSPAAVGVHRARSNCATISSFCSSGYSSACHTTASSSTITTPSSNRNNSEKRTEQEEQQQKDQQHNKGPHLERRHQLENYHRTVAEALARKNAVKRMPPDSSMAPTEGTGEKGEGETKTQMINTNSRLRRIVASPHRSALRVPQISAVSTKRSSIVSLRPTCEAIQPKIASSANSSLLLPPASRRISATKSANDSSSDGLIRVDFVPPTLTTSRICPQFSTVLPTAKRHFRATPAEGTNKRSSSKNNEQNDDRKKGETPEGAKLVVEEPIVCNSSSSQQESSVVLPVGVQQFETQKSVLRQPSAIKGRSKSAALRVPISSISSRPIDQTTNEPNKHEQLQKSDQCPSSSSFSSIPQPNLPPICQSSVPSASLPLLVPSPAPSPSLLISASASHRNSQLKLPTVTTKPVPPKRHTSTVIRTSAEEGVEPTKVEGEAETKEGEMNRLRLFGGKDREKERRKIEMISAPIVPIGHRSSIADQSEIHQQMPTRPKGKDHMQQQQQNEDTSSSNKLTISRKGTPSSKSLLLAPSSSVSRRTNSSTSSTIHPSNSNSGSGKRVATQCQQQRQQMQMSVNSNCSDCSMRSGETTGKRGTGAKARGTQSQQQMNTSQSSSSSNGARATTGHVKKPSQNMLQLMTTSSSSLASGIKTNPSRTANSDSKFANKVSSKKAKEHQQLETKAKSAKNEEEEEALETDEQRKCQTANSPLMTEKKPIMAVKGISMPSGGTPPPAQKGGSSQSGGGRPLSADSDSESGKSPSTVNESRRNAHTVVGVVSPMQHQQNTAKGGTTEGNSAEERGRRREGQQKQMINRQKEEKDNGQESEAAPTEKSPVIMSTGDGETEKDKTSVPAKESVQKVSKLAKSVPTKRLIIPTMVGQKSTNTAEESKGETNCKVPTSTDKCRGEECPSPSVPPPMAPTKLMSVLREEQASPCPSSSLSTPAEESISRFHFGTDHSTTQWQQNECCPTTQNQKQQISTGALISAVGTASDASTADAARTTRKNAEQLDELLGDYATIGGVRAATEEEGEEKDKLNNGKDGKLMKMVRKMGEDEQRRGTTEERKRWAERECPTGNNDNGKQQLHGAENGGRGRALPGGIAPPHQQQNNALMADPKDYASESELDFRRHPSMASHLHAKEIARGSDKLMMALDLRGTYVGTALPAGRRKSRFRERKARTMAFAGAGGVVVGSPLPVSCSAASS